MGGGAGCGDLHVLVVALGGVGIVGGDVEDIAGADGNVLVAGGVTSADLGALGVEGNGERAAGLGGLGLARVVNDRLVVLVCAVGEVHAHDVEASLAEGVDLLGGVGLGANGADDGGAAVLARGSILSVELRQPFDPRAAGIEVVERVRHCECGSESRGVWCCRGWARSAPIGRVRNRPIGVQPRSRGRPTSRVVGCWEGSGARALTLFCGRLVGRAVHTVSATACKRAEFDR